MRAIVYFSSPVNVRKTRRSPYCFDRSGFDGRAKVNAAAMREFQVDTVVANRFISSLSKSLQALCHGCMDFDSGIEIIGYININIDSGQSVNYVLNEKVLKSTTNSMTFVSNSFMARKEQQKSTRDEACSPIMHQHTTPSYAQLQHSHYTSVHRKQTATSYSQHFRGSQKRAWKDNKLLSSKRHHWSNPTKSSSTVDRAFQPPLMPSAESFNADNLQYNTDSPIRIKSEVSDIDPQGPAVDDNERLAADDQRPVDDFIVKKDPDEFEPVTEDNGLKTSRHFLGEATLGNSHLVADSDNTSARNIELGEPKNTFSNQLAESELVAEEEQGISLNKNRNRGVSPREESRPVSDPDEHLVLAESEPAIEDGEPLSQSTGDEDGENSQFEVIEIDDEDDVHAVFAPPGQRLARHLGQQSWGKLNALPGIDSLKMWMKRSSWNSSSSNHFDITQADWGADHSSLPGYLSSPAKPNPNMMEPEPQLWNHPLPYVCSLCGKGYNSQSGLFRHKLLHKGTFYMCPLCDSKFTQKSSVKTHLRDIHKSAQCAKCSSVYLLGPEWEQHGQQCNW